MWEISFYEKPNGRVPTQEFLDNLSPIDDLPFIDRKLRLLEELGHHLRRPHSAYLRDKIYELRISTRNLQIRLFYFFFSRNQIVFSHGIVKRTNAVPDSEIDKANKYRADYYNKNKE